MREALLDDVVEQHVEQSALDLLLCGVSHDVLCDLLEVLLLARDCDRLQQRAVASDRERVVEEVACKQVFSFALFAGLAGRHRAAEEHVKKPLRVRERLVQLVALEDEARDH